MELMTAKKYKQSDPEEKPIISRLTLHAYELELDHPVTGVRMKFTAPLPHDMEALLKLLRKYDK